MPLKPLAAKASVVNRNFIDDVVSSVVTEPDFTKDGFYNYFSKMLSYFCGDIVGLEGLGASVLRLDQPCRRCVIKGDEFNRRLRRRSWRQQLLRQQQGRIVPAQLTSLSRLQQVRMPNLEQEILLPTRAQCCARLLLSQAAVVMKSKASMSLCKSQCQRFEHSIARNKQF